jgi:transposase
MAVADAYGVPLAVDIQSARAHETRLVESTLEARFLADLPERLIGDKAYDSDPLDEELAKQGVELIAPHRRNRKRAKTQDGRKLRRYKRRWKIERLFSWLYNFRRTVVRYEFYAANFLAFIQLACIVILLRHF